MGKMFQLVKLSSGLCQEHQEDTWHCSRLEISTFTIW